MVLIYAVRAVHFLIVAFVVSAWAIPSSGARIAHLVLLPLMVLHWKTNNDVCFLTNLENRWMRKHYPNRIKERDRPGDFTSRLFQTVCCGRKPNDAFLKAVIYGVLYVGWLLSALGLYRAYSV